MNITGKFYVFANKKEIKGETKTFLSTNIAEKDKKGNIVSRLFIDVRFAGENAPSKKKIEKMKENTLYEFEVTKAFLDCRSYTNSDDELVSVPVLVILEAELTDSKKTEKPSKKSSKKQSASKSKAKAKDEDEDDGEDEDDEEDDDDEEDEMPF